MNNYEILTIYEIQLKKGLMIETFKVETFPPYLKGQIFCYEVKNSKSETTYSNYIIKDVTHSAAFKMNKDSTKMFQTFTLILTLE